MSAAPQRLGKYELRQRLGQGNMGEVWLAYDLQLRRDVAMKIIHTTLQSDTNFFTRFVKEGQSIASLHHTNIVQVHDVAVFRPAQGYNATAYMVMEYVEGETLADYIEATAKSGHIPPLTDIVYLFTSLAVAIDYASQKGIIHGNIKPSNILLNKRNTAHLSAGEPMLTDFSLAILLDQEAVSPFYMSPEQAKGWPASNRSDIYSLCVILYEVCTGVQPFRDDSSVAVMMKHIDTLPTPPLLINTSIPTALSEVLLRALSKDPAARFSTASLLAAAIADACSLPPALPLLRYRVYEDTEAYHTASDSYPSLLGVSQPRPKLSTPLPSQPAITGKHATIEPAPLILTPVNRVQSSSSSAKIPAVSPSQEKAEPTRVHTPTSESESTLKLPVPVQMTPSSPTIVPSTTPTGNQRREHARIAGVPMVTVVVALLLVLLLLGSALFTSLLSNSRGPANSGGAVGQVFFQDDALGHEDVLHIEMRNIAAAPQGKMYVAWLQDSVHHWLPLGQLAVRNSTASLVYPGDAYRTNLLSIAQGVVISLESSGALPGSLKGKIVFQAHFDSTSIPYIKNILYVTPNFPSDQSVVTELLDTIKSLNDKAGSIVDTLQNNPHDYMLANRQAIRIIELVDGTAYAMSSGDLPADDPGQLEARAGLLSSPTQPGYIDTLATQLDKLQAVAGSNMTLRQHIQNVRNAVNDLQDWVQKIRMYDVQLLKAADLRDPTITGVALQLKRAAADSYTGRTIPPNEGPLPTPGSAGAYQAYVESQYMATLDLKQV